MLEKLSQVNLPDGLQPSIGSDFSPVGQIYFYTLQSTNPDYDMMELKTLQDWVITKQLKSVPNVIDVSIFGGATREYQVQVDPNKLIAYGLSIGQVEQALANNNVNAGGSFIERGGQAVNVRAVGLVESTVDIDKSCSRRKTEFPSACSDVAHVQQGTKIRLGQLGKAIHHDLDKVIDDPDVVSGIVLLRKGADGDTVLKDLHEKVAFLNAHFLPPGVKIVPHLDRSDLVGLTTHTVLHNLTEGIILVSVILFIFLGNIRGALIVTLTIPFALLFASGCLDCDAHPGQPAVAGRAGFRNDRGRRGGDGGEHRSSAVASRTHAEETVTQKIKRAAHEVQRPVFYSILIIITAYVPIFTLQRVEGRLFRPMAWTVAFALAGALIFSMFLGPVVASIVYPKGTKEWRNPLMTAAHADVRLGAGRGRALALGHRGRLRGDARRARTCWRRRSGRSFCRTWMKARSGRAERSPPAPVRREGTRVMNEGRLTFAKFPEVTQVVSQVGRPDDGTDYTGFFNTEYFIDLRPKEEWRPMFHQDKEQLIAALGKEADKIPGVIWNFSQPIADNMEEAVSGVKGELAVKIYGTDLTTAGGQGR